MPTGYTQDIKDGISFQTFALKCAIAFGMRDERGSEKIPERFEPSDYHAKQLAIARERLSHLESMTQEECDVKAIEDHRACESLRLSIFNDRNNLRQQYQEMLACVEQWIPPTDKHAELKNFMINQIKESIEFDCDVSFYATSMEVRTGLEWSESEKEKAIKDISFYKTRHTEEIARTEERNAWINALRNSL